MKILVINPGSTSTKIAVYENETPLLVRNIKHTVEELSVYPQVIDQFESVSYTHLRAHET